MKKDRTPERVAGFFLGVVIAAIGFLLYLIMTAGERTVL